MKLNLHQINGSKLLLSILVAIPVGILAGISVYYDKDFGSIRSLSTGLGKELTPPSKQEK